MPDFDLIGEAIGSAGLVAAAVAGLIQLIRKLVPGIQGKERILSIAMGILAAAICGRFDILPVEMTLGGVSKWGIAIAVASGAAYEQLWRILEKPGENKTSKTLKELVAEAEDRLRQEKKDDAD